MMKKQNLSQEEFELIERYLDGSMNSKEHSAFEESSKMDARLSQNVEEVRLLLQAVEEQSLQNKLDNFHKEIISENDGSKLVEPIKRLSFSFKNFTIAASLALLMGLSYWLLFEQKSTDEKLFAQYFQVDPGLVTPMSTTSNYEFYRGMVDYKQGKYDLAIERWNPLLTQKPENDTLNYFIGISYLAKDDGEKAIEFLSKAINSPSSIFKDEAWYYLGLIKLKESKTEEAIRSFNQSNLENSKLILKELQE